MKFTIAKLRHEQYGQSSEPPPYSAGCAER
jgi:hypothetical protein